MIDFHLVQLFGVVGLFGMPALIVIAYLLFAYFSKKRQYHLAELMVEKGQLIPESFFEKKDQMDSSIKLFKNGLIFLAVGIGTALFGWSEQNLTLAALASVPALVGIAYIIVSCVVKEKEDEASKATETDIEK